MLHPDKIELQIWGGGMLTNSLLLNDLLPTETASDGARATWKNLDPGTVYTLEATVHDRFALDYLT